MWQFFKNVLNWGENSKPRGISTRDRSLQGLPVYIFMSEISEKRQRSFIHWVTLAVSQNQLEKVISDFWYFCRCIAQEIKDMYQYINESNSIQIKTLEKLQAEKYDIPGIVRRSMLGKEIAPNTIINKLDILHLYLVINYYVFNDYNVAFTNWEAFISKMSSYQKLDTYLL